MVQRLNRLHQKGTFERCLRLKDVISMIIREDRMDRVRDKKHSREVGRGTETYEEGEMSRGSKG